MFYKSTVFKVLVALCFVLGCFLGRVAFSYVFERPVLKDNGIFLSAEFNARYAKMLAHYDVRYLSVERLPGEKWVKVCGSWSIFSFSQSKCQSVMVSGVLFEGYGSIQYVFEGDTWFVLVPNAFLVSAANTDPHLMPLMIEIMDGYEKQMLALDSRLL